MAGVRFCAQCGIAIDSLPPVPAIQYPISQPYPHLEGIGGWLFWIAFSLGITPVFVVRNAVRIELPHLIHPTRGVEFLTWSLFLTGSLAVLAVLIALNGLFYSKKRAFPPAMIAYLLGMIVLGVPGFLFTFLNSSGLDGSKAWGLILLVRIFNAAIWIPYFLISRRVKVTFIH
jgi:hypothetical protein